MAEYFVKKCQSTVFLKFFIYDFTASSASPQAQKCHAGTNENYCFHTIPASSSPSWYSLQKVPQTQDIIC